MKSLHLLFIFLVLLSVSCAGIVYATNDTKTDDFTRTELLESAVDILHEKITFLEKLLYQHHPPLNLEVAQTKNVVGYGHIIKVQNMFSLNNVSYTIHDSTGLFLANSNATDNDYGYFVLDHDTVGEYIIKATDGTHTDDVKVTLLADPPDPHTLEVRTSKQTGEKWKVYVTGTGFDESDSVGMIIYLESEEIFSKGNTSLTNGEFSVSGFVDYNYMETGDYYVVIYSNGQDYFFKKHLIFDSYPEKVIDWKIFEEGELQHGLNGSFPSSYQHVINGTINLENTTSVIHFDLLDYVSTFEGKLNKPNYIDEAFDVTLYVNYNGTFSNIVYYQPTQEIDQVMVIFEGIKRIISYTIQ